MRFLRKFLIAHNCPLVRAQYEMDRLPFFLVAFVVAAYVFIVVGSVTVCWAHADAIVEGTFKCDAEGRLGEALAAALAAALALTGFVNKK